MRRGYKILVGTVVLISASIPFFFGASDNATELQKTVKITQESAVPTFEIEEEKEEERTASASVSVPAETKEEQTEAVSDRATPTPVAESAEPSIEIKQEEKTPKTEKPEESKEPIISVKTKAPPQDKDIEQVTPSCTLSVVCDDILRHPKKQSHIPANGIILEPKIVQFAENESVFDIVKRELKNNGIQLEFSISPIYNTAYIEGIANIYEFDYGDTSGWMYAVNGKIPTYGCSQYILQDGDDVVFFYRCSLYG